MRRKKSPIMLISIVCLAGTGLLVMSQQWSFYNKSPEEQMKEMRTREAERAQAAGPDNSKSNTPDPSALAASAKERLKTAGQKGPSAAGGDAEHEVSTAPSVVMPAEMKMPKPRRNDSSIEGQWWR